MRWRGRRQSSNVEDRRFDRPAGLGGISGGHGEMLRRQPVAIRFLGVKGTIQACDTFAANAL